MFKYDLYALVAAGILLSAGCATERETANNEDEKTYLEAWLKVNHPDAVAAGSGIYIIDDKTAAGEDETAGSSGYIFVTYTATDLEGNVTSTSDSTVAQRIGSFNKSYYYGPNVWTIGEGYMYKGIQDMVEGMTTGSTRTAVIPGWLLTYARYGSPEEYMENVTGNSHAIYTVKIWEKTGDIIQWQIDSLESFSKKYLDDIDSTSYGFYYKQLKEPVSTDDMPTDTTVYINYTGRLLNGQVFDTTIKDTAKRYNIYDSSKTYEPVEVTWAEEVTDIKLDDSSIITGFAKTLWEMKPMERGIGVFYSSLGYGSSGSGSQIPAYAPLLFDIELVENPEE